MEDSQSSPTETAELIEPVVKRVEDAENETKASDTVSVEELEEGKVLCASAPCRIGCLKWLKKYFWEGQLVSADQARRLEDLPPDAGFYKKLLVKHRRPLGIFLPAAFFHLWWWSYAIRFNKWHLFTTQYAMSITMLFGSVIAGMTTVGGGAVAFPVMTLVLSVPPLIARDFSFMIQACGMSAAAFTIVFMRIQLDWASLIFCSVGGIPGLIFGLEVMDPLLTPPQKKMGFVSVWFSFAFALFLLNRSSKRKTFLTIPNLKVWKAVGLIVTGLAGGLCSSFAGSGLDMCTFSVLTLLFRVSEKTATPTSVVLMAGNTMVGFYWRHVMMQSIHPDTWEYLFVCVPIVVIGAPLGSLLGSHFHRQVLACAVYILDTIALISAFAIVRLTPGLIGGSIGIIVGGFVFFYVLTFLGNKIIELEASGEKERSIRKSPLVEDAEKQNARL